MFMAFVREAFDYLVHLPSRLCCFTQYVCPTAPAWAQGLGLTSSTSSCVSPRSMPVFTHVSDREHALMRQLHGEGNGVRAIAKQLRRSTDTVSKHVFQKSGPETKRPSGRPPAITPTVFKKIQKTYTGMIAGAKAKTEVTVAKIKRRMRLKCCEKTISRALWSHGVHMRPLYEKPTLSDADKACRKAWAEEHQGRSAKQWAKFPHAVIDSAAGAPSPGGAAGAPSPGAAGAAICNSRVSTSSSPCVHMHPTAV